MEPERVPSVDYPLLKGGLVMFPVRFSECRDSSQAPMVMPGLPPGVTELILSDVGVSKNQGP